MLKRRWALLFLFFILADLVYSFYQHLHGTVLDGDLARIILPDGHYSQVLKDPFGVSVLSGSNHAAPNRYFVHGFMYAYFRKMPALLQHFVAPVESVYLACALLKTGVQLLLLWLLSGLVSGTKNPIKKDWLLAAVLVLPMFQQASFQGTMGIFDGSITYTCFYALPLSLLLLYFFPFFRALQTGTRPQFGVFQNLLLVCLAIVLSFSGPLVPPVVLITTLLVSYYYLKKSAENNTAANLASRVLAAYRVIPKPLLFHLAFFCLLCLYSLYIGMFNIENNTTEPLWERYARLPVGIFKQLTLRLGLPLLLLGNIANYFLLKNQKDREGIRPVLNTLKWLALFASLYLLLLPLGGYREYRPDIIRRDTILPITLCLVYGFGLASFFLLKHSSDRVKRFYRPGLIVVLGIYLLANWPVEFRNQCEKAALEKIARSPEKVVRLDGSCTVLSWIKISNYEDSKIQGSMLHQWGITEKPKLYFQE